MLFNKYSFHNLIYIDLPQSEEFDPYSFYKLVSVNGKKRKWNLVCRLEDITDDILFNLRPYCISLFRRIYCDIFNDNDYRPDYKKYSQIGSEDCDQLLQNIITLSRTHNFCLTIQKLVIEQATYKPTEFDKFNLYSDDKVQHRRFKDTCDSEDDVISVIKQLFDGMSEDDVSNILYK
jgi:hypothetical protein